MASKMREILLKIAGGEEHVFLKEDVNKCTTAKKKRFWKVEVIRVKA